MHACVACAVVVTVAVFVGNLVRLLCGVSALAWRIKAIELMQT